MRALLRDVRNVHQVFLKAVTVENIAARAFQIDAAWLPGLPFVRKRGLRGRALISGPVVFRGTPPQTPKVSLAVAAEAGFCRIRGRERRS
jgi:hypothetical protein